MKKSNFVKALKRVPLFSIAIGIMFALTGCGKTTVDLNKYVTIEENGYDTIGTATISFDYETFQEDYSSKIELKADKKEKKAKELLNLLTDGDATGLLLASCVNTQLDQYSNLSNGDTITLEWDCMDEEALKYFNCELKYSDIEYTVSNLQSVGSFNPFDYIEVEFTGITPNGKISINTDNNQAELQYILFRDTVEAGLSNGDTVTITAEISGSVERFVDQFGVVLSQTENTYTVENLPFYISSASEISTDALDQMKSQAEDVIASSTAYWYISDVDASMESITYVGNIFLKRKEDIYSGTENKVYLVYKILTHIDFTEPIDTEYYYFVGFSDLLMNNGECTVNISNYEKLLSNFVIGGTVDGWKRSLEIYGVKTVDDIESKLIAPNREKYSVENNMTE